MALAPGSVFAGFTIERTLGFGGMGTVYLARHPRLPRSDALKLLRPELSYDPDFAIRFAREADIAARLNHPNIVGVNDRGTEGGQLWISMPYIEGTDAEEALGRYVGPMPAQRAVRIVREIAAALDFAHRNGLWHRDVKPANILLAPGDDDEPERVLLTDFGIAKAADEGRGLTKTGNVIATFDYAPPEQIEGRAFDHRVDVYALGCVLYKLLTGSVPYPGTTMAAALHGHLNLPPPRPTQRTPWLSPGLDQVIARAMAKDPDDRYPTCRSLASAAQAALSDLPPAPPLPYSVSATRPDPGTGRLMILGPLDSDGLSVGDREGLLGLVRQSRLFDLPATLSARERDDPDPSEATRPITITVRATGHTATVSYLPDFSPRPPELDDLVRGLEDRQTWRLADGGDATPLRVAAPATVIERRPDIDPDPVDSASADSGPSALAAPYGPTGLSTPYGATGPSAVPTPAALSAPYGPSGPAVVPAPATPPHGPTGRTDPTGPLSEPRAAVSSPRAAPPTVADAPLRDRPPSRPPRPADRRASGGPSPARGRRRMVAILAAVVLVLASVVTAFALTRPDDDGAGSADDAQSTQGDTGAADSAEDAGNSGSELPSSAELGLPSGPALADSVLVAGREVDGNLDLYAVDSTTGADVGRLTSDLVGDFIPVIAPDRTSVVYLSQQPAGVQLWVVGTDGTGARPLFAAQPPGCETIFRPAWNPVDPSRLAVLCLDPAGTSSLRVLRVDGAQLQVLDPGVPRFDDLTYSPDGRTLVYWGNTDVNGVDGPLFALAADGSTPPVQLTDETLSGSADAIFSPDGTRIAFRAWVDDGTGNANAEIFVMNADGSDRQVRAPAAGIDQDPAWSPDGTMIAFKSDRVDGAGTGVDRLWIMNADGNNSRLVTDGEVTDGFPPAWSTR